MSLDVYLKRRGVQNFASSAPAIFIRENGRMVELSRDEWDARFPGREPVTVELPYDDEILYDANITHNLGSMARAAGIYEACWRPDEHGLTKAEQLIAPLQAGLDLLLSDPHRFKACDPANGWGDYDGFVRWVSSYLRACKENPDADVKVSR